MSASVRGAPMRRGHLLVAMGALAVGYAAYMRSDFHRGGNRLFYRAGRANFRQARVQR